MKIMTSSCDIQDIDREIAILKLLKHPNIVTLHDVIHEEETHTTYLAFELVNGGDLFDYTIARGRLSEREARRIMREIVGAIAYCHAHMVVHRDLKLENVLMDKDGHPKIAGE
jgi:serine/threonine protein kinase